MYVKKLKTTVWAALSGKVLRTL